MAPELPSELIIQVVKEMGQASGELVGPHRDSSSLCMGTTDSLASQPEEDVKACSGYGLRLQGEQFVALPNEEERKKTIRMKHNSKDG